MLGANNQRGAPPSHVRVEKKKPKWLLWALLALFLLALVFALSRCGRNEQVAVAPPVDLASDPATAGAAPILPDMSAMAGTSTLSAFLAGSEPTPRNFVFEKLNFETAKSDIRAADQAEVDAIAASLMNYPTTHVRIIGYADARGSSPANAALGKARADSVKKALVAKGVGADRVETATGGETSPVDTNTTPSGQAENRRTELVVTQR